MSRNDRTGTKGNPGTGAKASSGNASGASAATTSTIANTAANGAGNTAAQRDEATGAEAATERSEDSYANLKMPHERDETAAKDGTSRGGDAPQKEVVKQAKRDLDAGLQDTDCYGAVTPRNKKADA